VVLEFELMGEKSRGNWAVATCLPTCICRRCRMDRFEQAREMMMGERRKIKMSVPVERRVVEEILGIENIQGRSHVFYGGHRNAKCNSRRSVEKQLRGEI
jgi:hypothetical protein